LLLPVLLQAFVMGIEPSRIRVVSIKAGSVIVDYLSEWSRVCACSCAP
jgi:hypothetical protein